VRACSSRRRIAAREEPLSSLPPSDEAVDELPPPRWDSMAAEAERRWATEPAGQRPVHSGSNESKTCAETEQIRHTVPLHSLCVPLSVAVPRRLLQKTERRDPWQPAATVRWRREKRERERERAARGRRDNRKGGGAREQRGSAFDFRTSLSPEQWAGEFTVVASPRSPLSSGFLFLFASLASIPVACAAEPLAPQPNLLRDGQRRRFRTPHLPGAAQWRWRRASTDAGAVAAARSSRILRSLLE
jgi:hypothetical protein